MGEQPTQSEVRANLSKAYDFMRAYPFQHDSKDAALVNAQAIYQAGIEMQALQSRLDMLLGRVEEMERSRALYTAARDSDHQEASREITRLRAQVNNVTKEASLAHMQVQALSAIPEGQHADVMKDVAEVCEWLEGLGRGQNTVPVNVPRGSFAKGAEVVRRLMIVAKALIEAQPEALNLSQIRQELCDLADNTPGNADVVDGLIRALHTALKVIDRGQRATLRKEVGR